MFEKATRMKLRFTTSVGLLSVEDIWDLPLVTRRKNASCLDDLAKTLNKELKNSGEESFVLKRTNPNKELQLKFEIVKYIIGVKLAEREVVDNAKKTKEKKEQIMALIAEKKTESLKGKSVEELEALINAL